MIKNINDLKNIQIVCRNQNQVKDCLNYLKQLGFNVSYLRFNYHCIIFYEINFCSFCATDTIHSDLPIEFYNKELVKTLQKFIKQKEEKEKEKIKDIEVAEDGRIIKINNKQSEKEIFICSSTEGGDRIKVLHPDWLEYVVEQGLVYATQEARDRAIFKSKIEIKLKNIAERLNKGRKIDWEDKKQIKYNLFYNYEDKKLEYYFGFDYKNQGVIYCLDDNFLYVAKKEIGEENLIKYFKE